MENFADSMLDEDLRRHFEIQKRDIRNTWMLRRALNDFEKENNYIFWPDTLNQEFRKYALENYGIRVQLDGGWINSVYEIVNEELHVFFLLKYAASENI